MADTNKIINLAGLEAYNNKIKNLYATKASLPTKTSDLTNDSNFLTEETYKGTVTSVKVGTQSYNQSGGVVSLPAYPSYEVATHQTNGLMSSADRAALDELNETVVVGSEGDVSLVGAGSSKIYMDEEGNGIAITGAEVTINGNQLLASVPADAKFTDTTYDVASASANGLMSSSDYTKLANMTYATTSEVEGLFN